MKKQVLFCAGICAALLLSSCGSKESAYRKAYDKAKAAEAEQAAVQPTETEAPVVAPVTTRPSTQTVVTDNVDNATVRQESVTLVNGSGLKNFSVVVGSFSVLANAEALQAKLKAAGYDAQLAKNTERNLYRVIASTYHEKADAVVSRDALRNAGYADAWLLYNK